MMAVRSVPRLSPRMGARLTRQFSKSSRAYSYADTLSNLKIGTHTRVLFQGFTGELQSESCRIGEIG